MLLSSDVEPKYRACAQVVEILGFAVLASFLFFAVLLKHLRSVTIVLQRQEAFIF